MLRLAFASSPVTYATLPPNSQRPIVCCTVTKVWKASKGRVLVRPVAAELAVEKFRVAEQIDKRRFKAGIADAVAGIEAQIIAALGASCSTGTRQILLNGPFPPVKPGPKGVWPW